MRKITVFSMLDNSNVPIESSTIRTWGDVARDQRVRNMLSPDMKIIIKQTKMTIESEDSVLPEGDITIYLTPGKVKAGAQEGGFDYTKNANKLMDDILDAFEEAFAKDIEFMEKEFISAPTTPVTSPYSYF